MEAVFFEGKKWEGTEGGGLPINGDRAWEAQELSGVDAGWVAGSCEWGLDQKNSSTGCIRVVCTCGLHGSLL
jgi:hypothetical protein